MNTRDFLRTHRVFTLDEAVRELAPPRGSAGAVERLRYHLDAGRVTRVTREVYATVPAGQKAEDFVPDPVLVASAARADAVFSHHSALELLGVGHSVWNQTTTYTESRRQPLRLNGRTVRFLQDPARIGQDRLLATRRVEHMGRVVRVTGPERTLVEGFLRLDLAGGPEEFVTSAGGFAALDLCLLMNLLEQYRVRKLWSAVGWFLERFQQDFSVSEQVLAALECRRPVSPQYLERRRKGGRLDARWNLILPERLVAGGEPDES